MDLPEKRIYLQLEVRADNKIIVPGCEPSSALSSKTLSAYMTRYGCGSAVVDLEVALAAIPGSFVKYGYNFNIGRNYKWFVLPPIDPSCPCVPYPDYYQILKDLATIEIPEETSYDQCNMNSLGFCPSPDFRDIPEPPTSPYQPEGTFPAGSAGVLPPAPPWVIDFPTSA